MASSRPVANLRVHCVLEAPLQKWCLIVNYRHNRPCQDKEQRLVWSKGDSETKRSR
jgi:hypothetical protein